MSSYFFRRYRINIAVFFFNLLYLISSDHGHYNAYGYIVDSFDIAMLNPELVTLILQNKCNCCLNRSHEDNHVAMATNLSKRIALIYPQIEKKNPPLSYAYKRYLSQNYADKNEI